MAVAAEPHSVLIHFRQLATDAVSFTEASASVWST